MIDIRVKTEACGFFKLEKFKVDENGDEIGGTRTIAAPWFPNIITDGGLDRLGGTLSTVGLWTTFHVGSGNAVPAPTDTQLQNYIAGVTTQISSYDGNSSSAPWYGSKTETRRFAQGVAAGNLSEVGVSWQNTNGGLFSRALILDAGGSPTTITVLPDESLDVTYQLRYYAPTEDVTGTLTLMDIAYAWTSRARNVASSWHPGVSFNFRTPDWSAGTLTAVTSSPLPISGTGGTAATIGYTPGSRVKNGACTWELSEANGGNLRTILLSCSGAEYQISFDKVIPKNATRRLTLQYSHSWARRT